MKLTPEEVEEIAAAVPKDEVAGGRTWVAGQTQGHEFVTTAPLASYAAPANL